MCCIKKKKFSPPDFPTDVQHSWQLSLGMLVTLPPALGKCVECYNHMPYTLSPQVYRHVTIILVGLALIRSCPYRCDPNSLGSSRKTFYKILEYVYKNLIPFSQKEHL